MKKFTIIDYIIIILVICAVAFAFIHITTNDSSNIQKTAFDESTMNKIPDTYSKYYKDGFIVNSTVEGFNSSTGNRTTISGHVIWVDNDGGNDVKILIENENGTFLTGLYRYNPDADIYIDHISLESNGEKYKNLTEITVKPKKITSLKDLTSGIEKDTDYEITTKISLDSLNSNQIQEIINILKEHGKRLSIKKGGEMEYQLVIAKATEDNINDADSVLGNINGVSDDITIRVFNSTDSQINSIKSHFDVVNTRNF